MLGTTLLSAAEKESAADSGIAEDPLSCLDEAVPFNPVLSGRRFGGWGGGGGGAVRRTALTSCAIVSAPEFNLNVNLCRQDMNRMLSIKNTSCWVIRQMASAADTTSKPGHCGYREPPITNHPSV